MQIIMVWPLVVMKSESGVGSLQVKSIPPLHPNVFNDYYLNIGKDVSRGSQILG